MRESKRIVLIILDGWGIAENPKVSAIDNANVPFYKYLLKNCPHSKLQASGEAVGLPAGQMGNSEVGHMNIGAGRIVFQELLRIDYAVRDKEFETNETLLKTFEYVKKNNKNLHLLGLVSDGGVHSHINHLKEIIRVAVKKGIKNLFIHAFTDGRDCDPKSGIGFIKDVQAFCEKNKTGKIATVTGRYYAMDRDNRWGRIRDAYDAMTLGIGEKTNDVLKAIQNSYERGVTDEFIKPIICVDEKQNPIGNIQPDDAVLVFNFRTDRARQITIALTQKDMREYNLHTIPLYYVTMTNYDNTFSNVKVLFHKDNLDNTLGKILADNGKKQIRIAETEKYPHVTFFFNGGKEVLFENEKRILIPSPKVATYDLKPEMSAYEVMDAIVAELKNKTADFVCLNFANPDMVGHTGVFQAAVKACETVDACNKKVVEIALENGYSCIIIADHGNADKMLNEDGTPNTAHTTSLVPCIYAAKNTKAKIKDGKLGDLAPTILKLMNLPTPAEMKGNIIIEK